ncbi:MAG: hypothetical protein AB7K64_05300 [Variibacter sp.]
MALKAAAVAVVLGLGVTQAIAQPGYGYYDDGPISGIPLQRVTGVVRSAGLTPISMPRRVGGRYIVRSIDRNGAIKRVIVDAYRGDIIRIHAVDRSYPRVDAFGRLDRPPRPPLGVRGGVAVMGPDADPAWGPDAPPPRPRVHRPGVAAPKPAHKEKSVASAPAAPPSEQRPAHEADTESLPKVRGAVTVPAAPPLPADAEQTASVPAPPASPAATPKAAPAKRPLPTRSATIMPAKPPLPVRRPAQPAEPAVAKPDEAVKATTASAPRVVLPGGPTANGATAAKSEEAPKAAPSSDQSGIKIVPPQSYE